MNHSGVFVSYSKGHLIFTIALNGIDFLSLNVLLNYSNESILSGTTKWTLTRTNCLRVKKDLEQIKSSVRITENSWTCDSKILKQPLKVTSNQFKAKIGSSSIPEPEYSMLPMQCLELFNTSSNLEQSYPLQPYLNLFCCRFHALTSNEKVISIHRHQKFSHSIRQLDQFLPQDHLFGVHGSNLFW